MKIGLVSCLMKDNDIAHQLAQMEHYVSNNHNCDLICFGESFLQGFEGLTWKYDEDIKRALAQDDPIIFHIRELANSYNCGISFGFIEKENNTLYSSNMVVDLNGKIIDVFRRVSIGWKEPIASSMYKEGQGFHTFTYMDKVLGVAICGDVWHDCFLKELEQMNMDALLWPLYVDFSIEQWNESFQKEYVERTQKLPYPALMINSFVENSQRAKGG
ncbi:carbon-nitrogen hydrolase family protein [Proteinivorax tanatarense]|uniref:Carbon-nitrogen hydrolase family protein n=1 Tax=Proteinivorax tanatarense TaxID=1260629 RepID=A0AAU7VQF1_9FIRM